MGGEGQERTEHGTRMAFHGTKEAAAFGTAKRTLEKNRVGLKMSSRL